MSQPTKLCQPRLALGCRWSRGDDETVILFPEGAIHLEGPGEIILEQCDGQRTFQQIVERMEALYRGSDPAQIREDVAGFLEQLNQTRIVDY